MQVFKSGKTVGQNALVPCHTLRVHSPPYAYTKPRVKQQWKLKPSGVLVEVRGIKVASNISRLAKSSTELGPIDHKSKLKTVETLKFMADLIIALIVYSAVWTQTVATINENNFIMLSSLTKNLTDLLNSKIFVFVFGPSHDLNPRHLSFVK